MQTQVDTGQRYPSSSPVHKSNLDFPPKTFIALPLNINQRVSGTWKVLLGFEHFDLSTLKTNGLMTRSHARTHIQ